MAWLRSSFAPWSLALVLGSFAVEVGANPGLSLAGTSLDAGLTSDAGVPPADPFRLPGTQPEELTEELRSPDVCVSCHGYYADYAPNESWEGTMMANATRDPLFQAALAIANQDVPGSGDLCIRCHSPRGWLFGRSSPPELATLIDEDYEGVDCDFCHRLVPAEPLLIGTGQYTVANDFIRRGPIPDPRSDHASEYSAYHESSELCGLCHDVSNPAEGGFPIERTYSEWKASDFAPEGKNCQSCHMPSQPGFAAGARNLPERDVSAHQLAGGNTWIPRVLAAEYPELGREDAYERTARAAERMLQSAASLSLLSGPAPARGELHQLSVRVENLTGHKLPTGYPEGRKCWLELRISDGGGRTLLHSGRYDDAEAERIADPALRTFEVKMGRDGAEGFHFVLQNQLLQDNRIPPRGFVPAPDTQPVGREYPVVGERAGAPVLAHWDDAPYQVTVPADAVGPLRIEARLWYQTTSKEYVSFLRDENHTDETGQHMFALWEKHGRAAPVLMSELIASLVLEGDAPLDAGTAAPRDASAPDSGVPDASVLPEAGKRDAAVPPADATPIPTTARDAGSDASVTPTPHDAAPPITDALLDAADASGYAPGHDAAERDGGQLGSSANGCECRVTTRSTKTPAWLLVSLGSLLIGRRIRRGDSTCCSRKI